MKKLNKIRTFIGFFVILFATIVFLLPEIAEARRGGRSFGGSRSFRPQQSTSPRSFNTQRQQRVTSFGGTRITKQQAQAKYGIPKKVDQTTKVDPNGIQRTYNIHHYDGYASGLMTGYLMGHTSWLWMMPFHPAFYYSRPYYVQNEDGSVDVYPPTLSFTKILLGLIFFAFIFWLISKFIAKRRSQKIGRSSFI